MQTGRTNKRLWYDLWCFFAYGGASSWVLPPGHWLTLDDVESATLEFEVTGVGPAASKLVMAVQRTAAPSADNDLWAAVVDASGQASRTLSRGQSAEALILGAGGGLAEDGWSFPLGRFRTSVSASSLVSGDWAAVRIRAHVATR